MPTRLKGEVFRSLATKLYYWRIRAGNKKLVALGGEPFVNKYNAERAVKWLFPGLEVVYQGWRNGKIAMLPKGEPSGEDSR